MSAKQQLKDKLLKVATLRDKGQFTAAKSLLQSLADDPNNSRLGARTTLDLPRQLHSAFLKLAKADGDEKLRIAYQYHLVPPPGLLAAACAFSLAERMAISAFNQKSIPRKLHQVWIGGAATPPSTGAWRHHATIHQYDYQLWNEESLQELGVTDHSAYRYMIEKGDYPGAVDIARYFILQQQGGVYLDCDWYPARDDVTFHDLLPMLGLTAMPEAIPRNMGADGLLLANSFIAAPPGHPVFKRVLQAVDEAIRKLANEPAWWVTGPYLFTQVARRGSLSLCDTSLVVGNLHRDTSLEEVESWRHREPDDRGLLLAWKSWIWR